jgi:3-oxoacyl-[acyl-carrier-protein] synthase II
MTHEVVPYGEIKGSDNGLMEAILDATGMAGIGIDEIDAVYGFGNGMKDIDDIEKNIYGKLFDGNVPVINVRDITGEGRAASSNLSVAHAALTLSGELNANQTAYYVTADSVKKETVDTSKFKYVIAASYAFGGSYAAVVLRKAE